MTLIVDDRIGSRVSGSFDFVKHLRRAGVGAVRTRRLPFGDFAFVGHGPDGLVRVGVERKTSEELLGAISDNRFTGHQIPGLLNSYDYVILAVEGKSWPDPSSGVLMLGKYEAGHTRSRHLWANFVKFQLTLMFKARLYLWPTRSKSETVLFLAALVDWFEKRWKDHKSVYTVDETQPESLILEERTLKRRLAAQLPGVAWTRSRKVDRYFPSITAMFNASEDDWMNALDIKEGRQTAHRLVKAIYSEDITSQLQRSLRRQKALERTLPFARRQKQG